MDLEKGELAYIAVDVYDRSYHVWFRKETYDLNAKDEVSATEEAAKLLKEKFPDVIINLL